jgi:hydroxyacylglutathione hydrolase
MKIVDNLYAYVWRGKDNNCNSYVFAGALNDGRHVVIDPGHLVTPLYQESGLDRLIEAMDKDGIVGTSIGLVILTHGHPDHCEAAIAIREECRALVAIHEADEDLYGMIGGKVDIYLDQGTLALGDGKSITLQIHHSPGHSPGHVTLYWPERKVLIAGDCIFYRSTGRTDFPGGDALSLRQSIEALSQLNIEYLLCGHAYGNPGIIRGRGNVLENFLYIKNFLGEGAG